MRRRAGCLPIKAACPTEPLSPTNLLLLLITSRRHPGQLVLPKGGIEMGEEAREAALRECWEEAGIRGRLLSSIQMSPGGCEGGEPEWFIMMVDEEAAVWPEAGQRERIWMTAQDALADARLRDKTRLVIERSIRYFQEEGVSAGANSSDDAGGLKDKYSIFSCCNII